MNDILSFKTKTVNQGALILSCSTLISRFLGLIREWLLADRFGAGLQLDIYLTAFRIPDFIYNIFIVGGIVVAFLPLFSEHFNKDEKKAWQFTNNLINVLLLILVLICFLLFLIAPQILTIIAPGFSAEARSECVVLTRLMLLSPIFLGLSNIFSGILQHFNHFFSYALCPVFYNLSIIFGILFLSSRFGVLGIAIGVVIGALLHLLVQLPAAVNSGFKYESVFNPKDPDLIRVLRLMLPRVFGVAAQQINLIVMVVIASTLAEGSIAIFNFANNIQYLPVGVIGVSFATAAFPQFTRLQARGETKEFVNRFKAIFKKIFYLIIPVSLLMFVFRGLIVNIILKHGSFSQMSAQLTSDSLAIFCLSLWAAALMPLMFRAFFAFQDTKTPALIALFTVILNVALSFWFVDLIKSRPELNTSAIPSDQYAVLGLVLAFSLSTIVQFILSFILLKKKSEAI